MPRPSIPSSHRRQTLAVRVPRETRRALARLRPEYGSDGRTVEAAVSYLYALRAERDREAQRLAALVPPPVQEP